MANKANPTNIPPSEERFHANIVKMTGLIRRIVVEANKAGYNGVTPFIVDFAEKYLQDKYNKKDLIEGFITSSHPPLKNQEALDHTVWDKILVRDEEFFREKSFDIFKNLPIDAVTAFKKLSTYCHPGTGQSIISAEERQEIISYFHAFVKISIKYIHAGRRPYITPEGKYYYKNPDFMKGVDVLRHAKKWEVELEFSRA